MFAASVSVIILVIAILSVISLGIISDDFFYRTADRLNEANRVIR